MWSDRETEHDCLGFTSYVNVLRDVCILQDLAPLTVGIFGAWGSGKTSLMQMLKQSIDRVSDAKKVKTLWFNAWRYEGREEAQSALVHAILGRLAEDKTLLHQARDVYERLKTGASVLKLAKFIGATAMTMTPNVNEFLNCFREESEKIAETMESFHKDFADLLARMNVKHIVVFIDDLDRCSSAKVIETFETIKLFLNTPACTFVIGADATRIEEAVGQVYEVADGQRRKDYLEKIIQVPFMIPEQNLSDIACYIGMLIMSNHIDQNGLQELLDARASFYGRGEGITAALQQWPPEHGILFGDRATAVDDELKAVLPHVDSIGRGLRGNPRQIKRFLNIVALRRRLATENRLDIEVATLIKLGVVEYVWSEFFEAIADTVDPETGHSALIEETVRFASISDDKPSDSKLVRDSLRHAGLVDYLLAEPPLTGSLDLRPYLFLAQTSLSRVHPPGLVPVDEKALALARAIESDDPLRTKTAARQAVAQEPAVMASVVRILLNDLPGAKEAVVQTHILTGLATICAKHADQYPTALKAMTQFDPGSKDAVALAASTLLLNAKRAGQPVNEELLDRFSKASPIAGAFAGSKGRKGASSRR